MGTQIHLGLDLIPVADSDVVRRRTTSASRDIRGWRLPRALEPIGGPEGYARQRVQWGCSSNTCKSKPIWLTSMRGAASRAADRLAIGRAAAVSGGGKPNTVIHLNHRGIMPSTRPDHTTVRAPEPKAR